MLYIYIYHVSPITPLFHKPNHTLGTSFAICTYSAPCCSERPIISVSRHPEMINKKHWLMEESMNKDSTCLKVDMKYTHKSLHCSPIFMKYMMIKYFFICFSEDVQTNLKSFMVNLEFKVGQATEQCCNLTGRHRVMIVRKTLQTAKLFILMCIFVVFFGLLCIIVHYWGLLGIIVGCGLFIKDSLCELMWLNCNNF